MRMGLSESVKDVFDFFLHVTFSLFPFLSPPAFCVMLLHASFMGYASLVAYTRPA